MSAGVNASAEPEPAVVASPGGEATLSLSCLECRRLKRKCDRQYPCNHCTKNRKSCEFPSSRQKRQSNRRTSTQDLRPRLLDKRSESPRRPSYTAAQHVPADHTSLDSQSVLDFFAQHAGPSQPPMALRGPDFAHTHTSTGMTSGSSYPMSSPVDLSGLPALANAASTRSMTVLPQPTSVSPYDAATTETLERQPRLASGYEWDERHHSFSKGQDGTACLSVEPDGDGYLGFASGATLLRILQIIAGGVILPQQAPSRMEPSTFQHQPWRPSEIHISDFINSYFTSYHMQYPIIHEPTFRAQFQEIIPKPAPCRWDILSNTVIGLGAFCCGQPMNVVDYFLEKATSQVSATQLESGSLELVQAFCLLSNLAQKRNKVNSGSVYLGIAVRMAIGLGLHRELPLWSISPFEREVRRRVWWVVFIFDAGAAITFGRPILLPASEADVHPVRNVWDRAFPASAKTVPNPIDEPTIYSSLVHQSSFHAIGNKCYNRVISSPPPSSAEAVLLDHQLQEWHRHLPDFLLVGNQDISQTPPWLMFSAHKLFWRYCNLRIIIGRRAFLERALKSSTSALGNEADAQSATICLESALDTIRAISQFCSIHLANRLEKWYELHFLFHASFVPLIALHTDLTSPDRPKWGEAVDMALDVLRALKEEPLAQRCLQVVELLDPRRPFDGQSNDIFPWADLLQMDLLGDPNGGQGGPGQAETLLPFADFATLASLWPTSMH